MRRSIALVASAVFLVGCGSGGPEPDSSGATAPEARMASDAFLVTLVEERDLEAATAISDFGRSGVAQLDQQLRTAEVVDARPTDTRCERGPPVGEPNTPFAAYAYVLTPLLDKQPPYLLPVVRVCVHVTYDGTVWKVRTVDTYADAMDADQIRAVGEPLTQ